MRTENGPKPMEGLIRLYSVIDQDCQTYAKASTYHDAYLMAEDALLDHVIDYYIIMNDVSKASHEDNLFLRAAMGRSRLWH